MNIIDNVINTVAKEVGKVQERSQEMMQGFNLSNQIKELERKKNAKFMEIGRAIYDKYELDKEVSEERLKELVAEATAIDHEMAVLQAELDQIKVKNDPDATPTQKAEAKAGYSASPGFTCPTCGTPANREKAFCPSCGGALKAKSEESKKASDGTDEVEVEAEKA
ncbi:MAG TPA: zinc ribbon domain-containing protein [Candidatus Obscuribacter sp.]|nr:zinc ribbon domain-containing protein [Candidatus Obscuribacter sp.]